MSTTVAPAVGMMPTSSAVKIAAPGLGGGTSGFPERSSHSCTEVPAGALPMAGAVTVVRVPECSVPLGSGHLARAAGTREVATGPGWDSTATAGRRRAGRCALGLADVPGEARGRDSDGEEGRYQADNDGCLDTVNRPPQRIAAEKQPP